MNQVEAIEEGIRKRIESCKTKNGFPAGYLCAIRIETYEELLELITKIKQED